MREMLKFYINGQWVDPHTANPLDVINPATEEVCGRISMGSDADVNDAVAAAKAAAESFADFEFLPGRFHQLIGNFKDKWACDLDHPYRLMFEPAEVPIPKDEDGKQILIEIKILVMC